jgi:AraC-like DNA-binding protein
VRFEIFFPAPALRRIVRFYWTLAGVGRFAPQVVFPDGCLDMVFQLGDPFAEFDSRGVGIVQSRNLLAGQLRRPVRIGPTGRVETFGIRFQPGGAHPVLRFPLDSCEDRIVALYDVWGATARELGQRLGDASSDRARVRIADGFLLRLRRRESAACVDFALDRIASGADIWRTAELAREAGVSARHLQRLFREYVGMSPKLYSRVQRFQTALRLLDRAAGNIATAAADSGYFDQPHLIHDFREFTGMTPSAFLADRVAFLQDTGQERGLG